MTAGDNPHPLQSAISDAAHMIGMVDTASLATLDRASGYPYVSLVTVALTGLLIGGLGRLVVPGRHRLGLLATIAIGLLGSVLGRLLGSALHTGGLGTLLLEIAVAAATVALASGRRRTALQR